MKMPDYMLLNQVFGTSKLPTVSHYHLFSMYILRTFIVHKTTHTLPNAVQEKWNSVFQETIQDCLTSKTR